MSYFVHAFYGLFFDAGQIQGRSSAMIQNISVQPRQVKNYLEFKLHVGDAVEDFPFLGIDMDSYIVGLSVQSGLNFDVAGGVHCIQIGKGCSLAEGITFMIDLNHDYMSLTQGDLSILDSLSPDRRLCRKGTILIQNDVWIGHGATIMAGVTLHNGCVVASNSVVTRDVPPYAIVGGNPAKIIKYRFTPELINGLLKIAWWDWDVNRLKERRRDFLLGVPQFVEKYLPEADKKLNVHPALDGQGRKVILFVPDNPSPHSLYKKVLLEFLQRDRPRAELLLYMPKEESTPEGIQEVEHILQQFEARESFITLQTDTMDEYSLFSSADYFITTRSPKTVHWTGIADLYSVKLLYGTDIPVFPESLS